MPPPSAFASEEKKMINANLLPPDVKNEITQTKKNRALVKYVWLTVLVLVVAAAVSAGGWYYFSGLLQDDQAALATKQAANDQFGVATEKAQSLAAKIKAIKSIDDNTYKWSATIVEVQKVMPAGAYLTSVKLDSNPQTRGTISGYAASKQIVASLRDSLENSPKFQYVDIDSSKTQTDPTTQKDEENFTLSFSLEKGALK
jgi:Tfp pilus assembly protein PilN